MSKELIEDAKYAGKFLCAAFYDAVARPCRSIDFIVKSGMAAFEEGKYKAAAACYGAAGLTLTIAALGIAAGNFAPVAISFPVTYAVLDAMTGRNAIFQDNEQSGRFYPTVTAVKESRKKQLALRSA